jgi:hypothetical protein
VQDAAQQADADALFGPVGETLVWLTSLDDLANEGDGAEYRGRRDSSPAGQLFAGLREARNAAVHGHRTYRLVEQQARATGAYGTAAYGSVPYGGGRIVVVVWGNSAELHTLPDGRS